MPGVNSASRVNVTLHKYHPELGSKRCRECGKLYDVDKGEIEKRTAVTERGLEYKVWVCEDCWTTMGGHNDEGV